MGFLPPASGAVRRSSRGGSRTPEEAGAPLDIRGLDTGREGGGIRLEINPDLYKARLSW